MLLYNINLLLLTFLCWYEVFSKRSQHPSGDVKNTSATTSTKRLKNTLISIVTINVIFTSSLDTTMHYFLITTT